MEGWLIMSKIIKHLFIKKQQKIIFDKAIKLLDLDLDDIFIDDYYDDGKYIGFYVEYIEELEKILNLYLDIKDISEKYRIENFYNNINR